MMGPLAEAAAMRMRCYPAVMGDAQALPRPLTERERILTRWVIERGGAPEAEKSRLLAQLDHATVVRRCACGCASVDFAIGGKEGEAYGMQIVGDFVAGEDPNLCGVFVFCRAELLAGIEVYSLSGQGPCRELPAPEELRPYG